MNDYRSGFKGLVPSIASFTICMITHVSFTIYMIDCFALAMKTLSPGLQEVLQDVVKIVNHISANATTSRLFAAFCEEIGSDFKVLLLHTEVKWLSFSKVLSHLLQLQEETSIFLENKQSAKGVDMHNQMKSNDFLQKMAYLKDFSWN